MAKRLWMPLAVMGAALLAACAATPSDPVEIGANTYSMAAVNTAGAFGDVMQVGQALMAKASTFCASKGLHLQMVAVNYDPTGFGHMGGAAIQFQCTEHPAPVHLRPDNGVSTVTTK